MSFQGFYSFHFSRRLFSIYSFSKSDFTFYRQIFFYSFTDLFSQFYILQTYYTYDTFIQGCFCLDLVEMKSGAITHYHSPLVMLCTFPDACGFINAGRTVCCLPLNSKLSNFIARAGLSKKTNFFVNVL